MINPIILSCGSFLIFWYIIYFLRDDGFWGRIVSQPSWGDNQIMIIFVTSVLLLVSLVYFFKILKIETKNIEFVYLALYIFMVSASGFVYSISYSRERGHPRIHFYYTGVHDNFVLFEVQRSKIDS
jgi:hypothetical protein